jgi:hypothetical protein
MTMNTPPLAPITNLRSYLAYKFHSMRARAQRELFLAKISRRQTLLQIFPSGLERKNPNRKLLPTQDISIEKIVGTLNRRDDFDYKFRPLQKIACDRWVNTHLTLEREGWEPILVHKVGSEYFVEDGHHRISVANELGMKFIQAKIWEYPVVEVVRVNPCRTATCAETNSTKLYIPG